MNKTELQNRINYFFKDAGLLETALTHSSYRRENPEACEDNERLEFIGDGVLDSIIGTELYLTLPGKTEGTLTKLRSLIVCERSLSEVGRSIHLNACLRLGVGERNSGGAYKDSIIADAVEALIGAVLLDGGYDETRRMVLDIMGGTMEKAVRGEIFADYKSELQEYVQSRSKKPEIVYVTDRAEGPDHCKTFYVHVDLAGVLYGRGVGRTKKEASQNAAKEALVKLRGR